MKRALCFFAVAFSSLAALAQVKEGKVIYERTIQLQRPQNVDPQVAQNIPRSRTDQFELSFAKSHSLWEALPDMNEDDAVVGGGNGGGGFMMRFGGFDAVVYHNFETGKKIEQRELNNKTYLVEDSIRKLSWKITDETKTILNKPARKAVAQRIGTRNIMTMENGEMKRQQVPDTTTITAWFTTDIPVPAGPEFGGQLPGLILELVMNNGRIVYKATELSSKINIANIKEPKNGKRVTQEEFNRERDKIMEEMRKNMPPGRTIRIGS